MAERVGREWRWRRGLVYDSFTFKFFILIFFCSCTLLISSKFVKKIVWLQACMANGLTLVKDQEFKEKF
jgi:hypothetical protein